jgi:hypothetical protein
MNVFAQWILGLFRVMIAAAAGGVALVVIDPLSFNLETGWHKLLLVCSVLALTHGGMYLEKSPLPDPLAPVAPAQTKN